MHIREKISGQSFHVQSEVANNLIASGLCEAVVEAKKPSTTADFLFGKKPSTVWAVGYLRDAFDSGTLHIAAKCATCKNSMSWTGTAILKTSSENRNRFHHCGVSEQIPRDVLNRYAGLVPQKGVAIKQDPNENPMVRLFGGGQRDSETTYEVADPQQI